jgi:ABC-type polysaccharide/polyol phosphate transport system ATPase subunit
VRTIELRTLGKRYRVGSGADAHTTIREAIASVVHRPAKAIDLWALRDIDLDIDQGEIVGVIGRNGAGKTTLLKILSRITGPTTGSARTRGHVAALLDPGTGFHPELSGRDNVFLSGAIHGMPRREVTRRFDEIVSFAQVERFLDLPVKRYSGGMYLRLAFSVAAHLDAEILAIDELLAVGDAEFQRKCLRTMADFGRSGRTVVFVSHDLGAVARLCTRAIWLDGGVIRADHDPKATIDAYLRSLAEGVVTGGVASGDPRIRFEEVAIVDDDGVQLEFARRDEPFSIRVAFSIAETIPAFDLSLVVLNSSGVRILDESWSDSAEQSEMGGLPGQYRVSLRVPPFLAPDEYVVGIWFGSPYEEITKEQEVLRFQLWPSADDRRDWLDRRRIAQPPLEWQTVYRPVEADHGSACGRRIQ